MVDRLASLMHRLTDQSVFAELLAPLAGGLARVRGAQAFGRSLKMTDFIALAHL